MADKYDIVNQGLSSDRLDQGENKTLVIMGPWSALLNTQSFAIINLSGVTTKLH